MSAGGRAAAWALAMGAWLAALPAAAQPATTPTGPPTTQSRPAAVPPIVRVELTGIVDPILANGVRRAIERAGREGAGMVLLVMDTPGGMGTAMREIIQAILASPVPVVGYVSPQGAQAASAGTFILAATSYAAMAPGTTIGAAHPVGVEGEVLEEKVTNDAAAYIRGLATSRGRNAGWYERAVRESVAVNAGEALRLDAIDAVQVNEAALLAALDGRALPDGTGRQSVTVVTRGAPVRTYGLPLGARLIHRLIDPNIAYLLFLLGIAGLVYEVLHPGLGAAGVGGALALILALLQFQMLPVELAGLALIALGVGLFVLDLNLAGHAFLSVFGVACLLLGGFLLYDPASGTRLNPLLLAATVAAVALLFLVLARPVLAARRAQPVTGAEALVGTTGVALTELTPEGRVRAGGLDWRARVRSGGLVPAGREVVVTRVDGLTLEVETREPARPGA